VLEQHKGLPYINFSYDIECQHSVNRIKRFEEWFPHLVPVVQRTVGCIPKMHISNHKDDCMYRHSFNYTPYVGCTCGEGIETTWAEANQTAGSTKKENRGHRHDTLDDFHSYWNWEKIVKMRKCDVHQYITKANWRILPARSLARLYKNATKTLREIENAFDELTAGRDPALIAVWEKESILPWKNKKGEWESVYRLKAEWDEGTSNNICLLKFSLKELNLY
jgi:Kyakuja-Dileera-Zisupton transposase